MFRVSNGVCGLLCFGGYVEMNVDVLSKFIVVGEPTTLCLVNVWGGGFLYGGFSPPESKCGGSG